MITTRLRITDLFKGTDFANALHGVLEMVHVRQRCWGKGAYHVEKGTACGERDIFGEDFFVEIQLRHIGNQRSRHSISSALDRQRVSDQQSESIFLDPGTIVFSHNLSETISETEAIEKLARQRWAYGHEQCRGGSERGKWRCWV